MLLITTICAVIGYCAEPTTKPVPYSDTESLTAIKRTLEMPRKEHLYRPNQKAFISDPDK